MKAWKRLSGALITLLVLTVMLTGTALAAEPGDVSVQLNGKALAFTDAAPEITNGRTFLPFRAVLEAIGAEVGYDGAASTITIQRNQHRLRQAGRGGPVHGAGAEHSGHR